MTGSLWDTIRVPLLNSDLVALVDEIDWPRVRKFHWHLMNERQHYIRASVKKKTILLHRVVMRAASGQILDHINGNPLDNRRENLRFCTAAQNTYNRGAGTGAACRSKGVWKAGPGYVASISADNKVHTLGTFSTEREAAEAYDEAALLLHGRFARLNLSENSHDAETIPETGP